jgi:hypothetical protein
MNQEQNMDDARLDALRAEPTADFAERLRTTLRRHELAATPRQRWPFVRIAASAAAVAVMAALFSVPAVRASAQSFLSLFRVVNVVAVPVDVRRMDTLKQLDLPRLIGDSVQLVRDGGSPVPMPSLEQAGATAGFTVHVPGWLPSAARIVELEVRGEHVIRVTADAVRLQQLMDALGIRDLRVPDGLDGQIVTMRVPPVVMVRYEHGGRHTRLFQTQSPEVQMPSGVNPAALGEIGLRVLGVSRDDAKQFAGTIDWNTTLLVPVPPAARLLRPVSIGGSAGIAFEHQPPNDAVTTTVLWSRNGRVFGLTSVQERSQVLDMANSIE